MGDPGRQRGLVGQRDDAVPGGSTRPEAWASGEMRVIGERPQGRIDHPDPVDGSFGVDMDPQVLETRVPRSSLEHQ